MNIIYIAIGVLIVFLLLKKKNKFSASSESYSMDNSNTGNISDDSVLIFHAPWCGHCKKSMGEFKNSVLKGRGKVILINTDENPDLVKKYGVQGFPTIMKGDRTLYTGQRTSSDIINFLNE
jgi:protein disulfide-isomerase